MFIGAAVRKWVWVGGGALQAACLAAMAVAALTLHGLAAGTKDLSGGHGRRQASHRVCCGQQYRHRFPVVDGRAGGALAATISVEAAIALLGLAGAAVSLR